MKKIQVNHYTDTVIYKIDKVIKGIKSDLNKYVSGMNLSITTKQYLVLDTIASNKEICQQDVATILDMDKSNIKRIVEILESKGLIDRTTGRKNNRLVNYLTLTKNGQKFIDENVDKVKTYLEETFDVITDEELSFLKFILEKLQKSKDRK